MQPAGRSKRVRPRPGAPGAAERGLTLLEVVVAVALLAVVAATAAMALAGRPAQAAMSATKFAGLVSEARALAAITQSATAAADGGATIGVVRTPNGDVATLYANRPIRGAAHAPSPAAGSIPLQSAAALEIVANGTLRTPPFAIFISPSGRVSAAAPYSIGIDAPLAAEPACPVADGITIVFRDGVHDRGHAVSCALAQLDLDDAAPYPR